MRGKRIWRQSSVITAVLVLSVLVGQALASTKATPHNANKGAKRLVTVTETVAATTSSTSYVNLGSAPITVPGAKTAILEIRFAGESQCTGSALTWCTVRVLVDGAPADPNSGTDFAFDSAEAAQGSWESHSHDWTSAELTGGNHTVVVQWAATNAATEFRMDDWQLTVEEWFT